MDTRTAPARTARRAPRTANLVGAGILLLAAVIAVVSLQSLAAASDGPATHAPTVADGLISESDAVSVFDDTPAVSNLDPALLDALRAAATDAEADGVRLQVNSGWRSATYQNALREEAVAQYGSEEEAARWVATPENSEHVSGDAVDLGPLPALDWLERRGAAYGLCQVYANERWHFELRPGAPANGCPLMYADPTADPRTQR